jgi:twinkle protein
MALSTKALAILEKRGLEPETLARLGVTSFAKDGFEWVEMPYFKQGVRVNAKYRSIEGEKLMRQDAGAVKCFYNFDCLLDESLVNEPLIITEGEFDTHAAIQAGFSRVVSVPDGAPATPIGDEESQKYTYLDDAAAALADIGTIIIASDGDNAGNNLLHDLALRLGKSRCKFLRYPAGCKDLNDALEKYGVRGVTETIARAAWVKVDGVYAMDDLPPEPETQVYPTGFPLMDENYKVRLGDLTIVTGIPSHGKSTFVNDLCCRLSDAYGWVTAFASFEQHPSHDHKRNLRKWRVGRPWLNTFAEAKIEADAWINKQFCFLVPNEDDDVTLEWVLERANVAVVRFGAKVVVIDPWNEMDHSRPRDMSLTEYTGFAIKQFRKFARKHRVHLIIVAHPSKPMRSSDGSLRIPTLYDISDSAHWYNKADVGIVVHRDDDERSIIRIAKSRYHDIIGKPGDRIASFDQKTGRYSIIE